MSIFTHNKERKVKGSFFNMSHEVKMTMDMPFLVPFICRETLPGDKWQLAASIFGRMQPMLAPMMQDVNIYVHYFSHPLRVVSDHYDDYFDPEKDDTVIRPMINPWDIGEKIQEAIVIYTQSNPSFDPGTIILTPGESGYVKKYVDDWMPIARMLTESSLLDYMGIPVHSLQEYIAGDDSHPPFLDLDELISGFMYLPKFSAFPFVMYQNIYGEYYRDQNLEDHPLEVLGDQYVSGWNPDSRRFTFDDEFVLTLDGYKTLLTLRTRAWRKDYFTSALPTPQTGPDVHLPLTGDAPVVLDPLEEGPVVYGDQQLLDQRTGIAITGETTIAQSNGRLRTNDSSQIPITFDPNGTLKADMSGVTSATINELRRAVRAQEFLERTARGGKRYIEMILSHFGVRSSDARLDRPEFLGGGRQQFQVSEVLSHVGESDDASFILGEMGGHAVSYGAASSRRCFFEEHGFIFGIISVLPRASYMQGLDRQWSRTSLYDYYWREFANLGEQEIKNKELYAWGTGDLDAGFGYAPRYSEYKYIPSSFHGAMRSSLSYWHLGRIFDSAPRLSAEFMHPDPEQLKRIFAVTSDRADSLIFNIRNVVKVYRRMPKYGIPTL